jgi:very-short-patch-repair endonuclease
VDDRTALAQVAREALRICHFEPTTGEDLRRAPRAREDCEAACYDCLLSYGNQMEHPILDRKAVQDVLLQLANAEVKASPAHQSREEHLQTLLSQCQSELERQWLRMLYERGLRLPDSAQSYIDACKTRPDFVYKTRGVYAAVYIDGPPHDYPQRQSLDRQQTDCMDDRGFCVIRFGYRDDWTAIIEQYKHIFGGGS